MNGHRKWLRDPGDINNATANPLTYLIDTGAKL